MLVFQSLSQSIIGVYDILSTPISYLGGLSLINIAVALASVTIVKRFLLDPLFSRHKQDSATEKKRRNNE